MADNDFTTLDHIDNIRVPGRPFIEASNEYWALICLRQGLEFLYHQASHSDQVVKQRLNADGKDRVFVTGNHPAFDGISRTLLTCAFHWYAVSACQYVRTIGAIAYRNDKSRPAPPKYVESVIPEVLAFRDKVAAHFAWSTQNSKDNDAERLASVMPTLTFVNDSFHVGAFTVYVRHGDKTSESNTIKPWSICEVHERLRERYWPSQKPLSESTPHTRFI
jgi:hypothetical protein